MFTLVALKHYIGAFKAQPCYLTANVFIVLLHLLQVFQYIAAYMAGAGPAIMPSMIGNTSHKIFTGMQVTGTYFAYTARLNQLSNDQEDYGGMMTHIVITP